MTDSIALNSDGSALKLKPRVTISGSFSPCPVHTPTIVFPFGVKLTCFYFMLQPCKSSSRSWLHPDPAGCEHLLHFQYLIISHSNDLPKRFFGRLKSLFTCGQVCQFEWLWLQFPGDPPGDPTQGELNRLPGHPGCVVDQNLSNNGIA